jgi:hypothetical protein
MDQHDRRKRQQREEHARRDHDVAREPQVARSTHDEVGQLAAKPVA